MENLSIIAQMEYEQSFEKHEKDENYVTERDEFDELDREYDEYRDEECDEDE